MAKRRHPEQDFQKCVAAELRALYPSLLWFHVPNGGDFPVQRKKVLADMGVLAGAPDLVIVLDGGRVGFLELKARRGRLSDAQQIFRDRAVQEGAYWACGRELGEVKGIMRVWTAERAKGRAA